MSWWRRLMGKSEPETPAPEPAELVAVEEETRPPDDPELRLESLGDEPSPSLDTRTVLELIERLRALGREARAIDLARRVLAHHPEERAIHQRVAEMLTSRGDDDGAGRLLAGFTDAGDAPLDLLMLAAEIHERRGLPDRALGLYERIVARDLDYPRARARVRRLREGGNKEADLGATLMADGALTRGRYRVERELGRGGAGTVFLAEDLQLERRVALKVYHRRGRAERTRLLIEARVPARFEHPGVVRIFDLEESLAAIVMERVTGGAVRGQIRKGQIPLARALRWFITGADALSHVHQRGYVHRDFKPSNMLLRETDRAVLTDFGLACPIGEEPEAGEGTRQYMPPEQRRGDAAAPTMDVFALGVSLDEVMTHCPETTPPEVLTVVRACMAESPEDRPDASHVRRELEAVALARSNRAD
ncbi:MAG: protein kinase [Sandaracinaceae bacterium]